MNFDALTVAAVGDELRAAVLGGRVQHVHHPGELALALEVYARGRSHWLYCSAHPQHARVHLVSERPPRTSDAVSPLLLLLRKYVDGARLDAVDQPALERILRLRFSRRAPDGALLRTELVVEAMGRHSNLILLEEDGSVLDAIKRITPAVSRVRTILPHRRYDPPPAPAKLDPRVLGAADLARAAGGHPPDRPLRDVLVAAVNACSPLLAREVVFRAGGASAPPAAGADWEALAEVFRAIWSDAAAGRWGPTLAYEGDQLVAYAAYPLHSFPEVRPAGSISRALQAWFGRAAPPAAGGRRGQAAVDAIQKQALRQALEAARDRLRAKRYSLAQRLVTDDEVARLRRAGEYLLAFGTQVPPGAPEALISGEATRIPLDPTKSAVENAQAYFDRYAKAKSAAREVPPVIAQTEQELRYLDEALLHLDLASGPAELAALRAEWADLGYVAPAARSGAKQNPDRPARAGTRGGRGTGATKRGIAGYHRVTVDGFEVLVGRSGRGNDELLARGARPDDVWLHARGLPGAHVVIRTGGRAVPAAVLRRAASLAAAHSHGRNAPSVAVDYTRCKYVDRIKGAPPGLATYRGERTIYVPPEQ